ncbi:hypothetical protein [Mycobacterium sp. NPDC006124]|uniref:hypothetical protein n=1 Tax=Mycobacterium sp. NPDC006124 TaxID=3156729 RepID=UPI0033BC8CE5
MTNPSKESPIEGRDWSKSPVPHRQCTAHKKNGDQCKNAALRGATVCKFHGGAARHVRNAARARLANAADRMAKELLNMATDEKVSDAVKLNAIRDALDRAGLKPGIEVEIGVKPVDQIMDQIGAMTGGSREAFRRGIADGTDSESDQPPPALAVSAEPVDAEVVDDDFDVYGPLRNQQDRGYTVTPDGDVWPPTAATASGTDDEDDSLNPFAASGPPPDGMMTRADAYAAQAEYQRRIVAERQAEALASREAYQRERTEQRALPPGRIS